GVPTEYYLVENRQKSGRDANLPASGIAVWHIDELGNKDNQSLVYNTSHANYEVTLVQADNQWHFQNDVNSGDAQDLYYSGNTAAGYNNWLSDTTAPSARWWDGSASGINFGAFSVNGTTMTFNVQAPGLTILTQSPLPAGSVGVAYSQPLLAIGGKSPYTWAVVSNALPADLVLSNGVISGTPGTAGTTLFRVRVTDATNGTAAVTLSLTVNPPRSVPFSETFENGGSMPSGWTQEYVTGTTSWICKSGGVNSTPPSAHSGSYNACFYITDYSSPKAKLVSPMLDFGVAPQSPQMTFWHCMPYWSPDQDELRVYYKTAATNTWILLAAYTTDVAAWTQRTLALPTPSRTYFIAFEGLAKYGYGVCVDDVYVSATSTAPTIVTASPLPSGSVATPYSLALTANGGTTPYTWAVVSNALPSGLTLGGSGVISGTPGAATNVSFRLRVTGSNGLASTNLFELAILARRAVPFIETFENASGMPSGWTQEYVTNTTSWTFQSGGYNGKPKSAHGGSFNACLYIGNLTGPKTKLVSPLIDFGASVKNAQLTFWHCMQVWSGDQDELRVYYKTTATNTWMLLATYTNNVSSWTQRTLALSAPSRTTFIAFEGLAKFGYGVCIDDVGITGEVSPYAMWQTNRFTEAEIAAGGIAGAGDDPDGDGIANLLEYAMGLNPRLYGTAGVPVGGVWNRFLTLNYRQNKQATDLVYAVEACTNLTAGGWATNNLTEIARADSNLWWSVTTRHNVPVTNAPSRFMRLKVTLP
ncbi:MAG: choice-of-anchor J domain-containing protein, partial [bacterium]